jgi:hypothetical protein
LDWRIAANGAAGAVGGQVRATLGMHSGGVLYDMLTGERAEQERVKAEHLKAVKCIEAGRFVFGNREDARMNRFVAVAVILFSVIAIGTRDQRSEERERLLKCFS